MISYSLTKKIKNYSRFYIQYFLLITFLAIIVYTYFYFLINQNWKISLVHIGFYLLVVLLFWFSTNGLWFFFEFRKEYKERRKWQIQTEEDCEKLEKLLKRFPKLLLVLKYNFRSDAKVLFFHRGKFQQRTYDGHMELVSKTEIVDFTKYIMSNRCTINKTLREINKVTKRWRKKHKKYFRKGIFEAYYIGIGYRHLLTKEQIYI